MRICIDSYVFIHALDESDPDNMRLLDHIGQGLTLTIPRLVAQEVTRNLQTPDQVRRFVTTQSCLCEAVLSPKQSPKKWGRLLRKGGSQ